MLKFTHFEGLINSTLSFQDSALRGRIQYDQFTALKVIGQSNSQSRTIFDRKDSTKKGEIFPFAFI